MKAHTLISKLLSEHFNGEKCLLVSIHKFCFVSNTENTYTLKHIPIMITKVTRNGLKLLLRFIILYFKCLFSFVIFLTYCCYYCYSQNKRWLSNNSNNNNNKQKYIIILCDIIMILYVLLQQLFKHLHVHKHKHIYFCNPVNGIASTILLLL